MDTGRNKISFDPRYAIDTLCRINRYIYKHSDNVPGRNAYDARREMLYRLSKRTKYSNRPGSINTSSIEREISQIAQWLQKDMPSKSELESTLSTRRGIVTEAINHRKLAKYSAVDDSLCRVVYIYTNPASLHRCLTP